MAQDRGAGRRHPLARDAVVDRQEPFEQDGGRGSGRGQQAMRACECGPSPAASGPTVQRAAPISPISQAAATMSAIESQAPTSWKRTSSGSTP